MSQQSSSTNFKSTWGKFSTKLAAIATKTKLAEAGIAPEKIKVEMDNPATPKLEDYQAIANNKTGVIAGGIMGFVVGLSINLVVTNVSDLGFSAIKNFQAINYVTPVVSATVGAIGMGLISGNGNASFSKLDSLNENINSQRYMLVVEGTPGEISLARELVTKEEGVVEFK